MGLNLEDRKKVFYRIVDAFTLICFITFLLLCFLHNLCIACVSTNKLSEEIAYGVLDMVSKIRHIFSVYAPITLVSCIFCLCCWVVRIREEFRRNGKSKT